MTASSTIQQKSALSAAYAELGKELTSVKLKAVGSYTLGKMIGEGTYGKVRLGTHRLTGTKVAIKQVPKAHSASLTREIHHHRRLHHPNVMQLYEVMATESYIWMVTELCPGGELYDYLVERGTMSEPEARRMFGQLCLAVAYVHDRGIVHRDLKLENVLLDERCNVKLGDFGFTREYEGKKLMETFCGTTGYAAPEMLAGRKYTGEEVDIWSLGVILYALLCGALPFDDDDDSVMKDKILKGDYELPEALSEEARDLISKILQQDASTRPSIKSILDHPWFHKVMLAMPMATLEEDENSHDEPVSAPQQSRGEGDEEEGKAKASTSSSLLAPEAVPGDLGHRASVSAFSEMSFYSAKSKTDSESSDRRSNQTEVTEPTTAEEDDAEVHDVVSLDAIPIASISSRGPLVLHRNESQSTIRREGSSGSEASRMAPNAGTPSKSAAPATLPTHHEGISTSEMSAADEKDMPGVSDTVVGSQPLEKRGSQSSSRGGHHRTPSRTKRRSSGGLSEHFPPLLDLRPTDYVALLEQSSPAMFSTVTEQNILHQLSSLGMDVGQIVHSVVNEACDASGAMWWILKKKASEKEQGGESPIVPNSSLLSPPPPLPPKDASRNRRSSNPGSLSTPMPAPVKRVVKTVALHVLDQVGQLPQPSVHEQQMTLKPSTAGPSSSSTSATAIDVRAPSRPVRLQERHRTSSFSVRLSNVLGGKDRDSKRDGGDTSRVTEEQLALADRSKSPVSTLFNKMSGSSSPSSAKEKRKDGGKTPLRSEAAKVRASEEKINDSSSTSRSSPKASVEESVGRLSQSKSMDTFSTVSSSAHGGGEEGSPSTARVKPSFLSAVRTWFEDKDKSGTARKKKKQRAAHLASPPPVHAHGNTLTKSGSIRRKSGSGHYHPPPSAMRNEVWRSPRHSVSHRTGSLSRRSSSGSGHYPQLNSMPPPRPKTIRRQSAGSITPTATMSGDDFAAAFAHSRGSRPSSAHSMQRIYPSNSGLHGKSGSSSSTNSLFRHQQQQYPHGSMGSYNSSLRGTHSRRSSLDGGTVVRKWKRHPSPRYMARTDNEHSLPSTPSRLGAALPLAGEDLHELLMRTPRRSLDIDGHGRSSPLHAPRAGQSVFVAHKSRTPYKPPSYGASGTRHNVEHHSDRAPRLGTWRRSWGRPPPGWVGPVDSTSASTAEEKTVKPKLRDVFANKESDDDWEDEDVEPMYAGGLGQLDSSASQCWSNQGKLSGVGGSGKEWDNKLAKKDAMPTSFSSASRYAGIRTMFQPPTLGRETAPKAWTMEGSNEGVPLGDDKKLIGGQDSTPAASRDANTSTGTATSRMRNAAPAFKGADIMEEDEEEDG